MARSRSINRILFATLAALAAATRPATADVVLENASARLVLSDDARAKSLVVKASGEELLDTTEDIPAFSVIQNRPFNNEIKLTYPNRRTEFHANRLRRSGNDLLIGFERISYEARLRITEAPSHILLELIDFPLGPAGANHLSMTYPPAEVLKMLVLPVRNRARFGEWLNVGWDDRAAVSLFAAEPYTWIENTPRHGFRLFTAEAHRELRLRGARAALIACETRQFLDSMDAAEAALGLPRGVRSRRDPRMARSFYWTADLNPTNVERHIALARRAGLEKMLVYHTCLTTQKRSYATIADYAPDTEAFPDGYESIRDVTKTLKDAGIMPGLHILQTFIGFETHYVTPVADPRLNLKSHFTLERPLSASDAGDLYVQEDPSNSPTNTKSRILAFGGELIGYEGFTTERPYRFTGITRGAKRTNVVDHPRGQIGGVLDVCEFKGQSCYIDQNSDLQDEIAKKIARLYDCGFEFLYNDGSEGVNAPQGIHVANAQYRVLRQLGSAPLFTEGAAKSHFGWHFQSGANAFDVFRPEKFKAMIARWPLAEAPLMRDDFTQVDFGWWRCFLPSDDTIGTQPDMWEYGTSKAASWDCPVAIQMDPDTMAAHPRADDLLSVLRRWEDVRARRLLTPEQRAALRDPKREFHLYETARGVYELCEIEMLPAPASAPHLRGFLFTHDGRRLVAHWHTCGAGRLEWVLGPAKRLADLAYQPTDLAPEEIRAAWKAARLTDESP